MEEDNTQSAILLTPGTQIRQYCVINRIGAGGMGEVYEATDTSLDRRVALKFLAAGVASDPERRTRFVREAKAAAKLSHPNIVTVFEVSEHDGRPFIAMEHVTGESLHDIIDSRRIPPNQAVDYTLQITDALIEAHAAGIVHRDVKPANVVVDARNQARLLDFGLARIQADERITLQGTTMGTLAYMSPEQVEGKEVDGRTDIYSLGILLFQLLTRTLPFRKNNDAAVICAIVHEDIPSASRLVTDLPQGIDNLLARFTAKNPEDRFVDASAVREALLDFRKSAVADREEPSTDASIAVMPFANMSADPEQEYFCDGIAEDVINDLTQVPGLRVVARTSAFAFKGKNDDVRHIGRQLGVAHVLEGSVRKANNRLRITAQLVKVSDGYHLWSERYDRNLDDIFAIQDDISRTIVETLKLKLAPGSSIARSLTNIPVDAYQLYSKGRYHLNLRTPAGFQQALEYFEECARTYPDYSLAHVGLADTHFLLFAYDIVEPRDAIARARNAVQRAIELDPCQAEAYTTLAGILTYYDWDWEQAEATFAKAIEFGPGYATAHQWYGELLSFAGRDDAAEKHLLEAQRCDPLATIGYTMLGCHHLRFNRSCQALDALKQAEELGTDNDATYGWLGFSLLALGRTDDAIAKLEEGCRRTENGPYSLTMLGHALALLGNIERVVTILRDLEARTADEYIPESYLATLYFDTGDETRAAEYLTKAVRRHNTELVFIATMPYYRNLRKDTRLNAIIKILGLTP